MVKIGFMKNSLTLAPNMASKIEEQLEILTQKLARMHEQSRARPEWTRADLSKLQQHVQHSITQTITLAVNKEKWLHTLPSSEKRFLFKNLNHYITARTQIVIQNITGQNTQKDNQNLTNKRLNFAKKLFLSWLYSLNNLYDQKNNQKEHKRWLRLLAALEAKKKADEETRLLYKEYEDDKIQSGPVPVLIPKLPLPEEDDQEYVLLNLLELLGLGIGANRAAIEQAFAELKAEFEAIADPTAEETALFEVVNDAYAKLCKVDESRLLNLTEILEEDISRFANALKPFGIDLLENPTSMESIGDAYNQYAIQNNLDSGSPSSKTQMQKMEVTFAKMEYRFGSGQDLVNIGEKLQQRVGQEQARHTPQLTLNPSRR